MNDALTDTSTSDPAAVPALRPPIVVFGTGGSGTRAMSSFLQACGIRMGQVNGPGDALAFATLLSSHVDAVMEQTRRLDYKSDDVDPQLRSDVLASYRQAAEEHCRGLPPGARWGFKNPRHIFMLPFIDAVFPGALFVHVLRDGRDMLLSHNRNQPRKHFEQLLGRPFEKTEADVARFWAKSNSEARDFARDRLANRYAAARIEDLCGPDRQAAIASLSGFLALDPQIAAECGTAFESQESFGRGQNLPPATELPEDFRAALSAFGYA